MALSRHVLTPIIDGVYMNESNLTAVSASFTPDANSLLVLVVSGHGGGSVAPGAGDVLINSNTGGLSFSRGAEVYDGSSAWGAYATIFTAAVGGSPSSMTVTLGRGNSSTTRSIKVHAICYGGYNTASPTGVKLETVGAVGNRNTSWSPALTGTPASGSEVIALITNVLNSGPGSSTPGTNWTEQDDRYENSYVQAQLQYRAGDGSFSTVLWNNTTDGADVFLDPVALALEIKAATDAWTPSLSALIVRNK